MLLRVRPMHFVRAMTSGRTCPIACGCSDLAGKPVGEFVIKLLGQQATLYEFVASRLATHFGILVPEAPAVEMDKEFERLLASSQPQLAAALHAGLGLNFGTRFMNPMSTWPVGRTIPEAMLADATKIFAFDALIQNPDRRVEKPNLLTQSDDLYILDHESGFSFLLAIGGHSSPWNLEREAYLQNHVFYNRLKSKRLDLREFEARLEALTEAALEKIRSEIPNEWMHEDFGRIGAHLSKVHEHRSEFLEQVRRILV